MNKRYIIPAAIAAFVGFVLLGKTAVFAETTTQTSPFHSLIQKLATRFHLNQSDVQAVFEQNRLERQQQMQARFEQRLAQAVSEDKITDAQKQLILAKHTELQKQREVNRNQWQTMTVDERKTEMEKHRQEFEAWAKANGIDPTYFHSASAMRGPFGGRRRGWHMGM